GSAVRGDSAVATTSRHASSDGPGYRLIERLLAGERSGARRLFGLHHSRPLVLRAWCKRHASWEGAQDRGNEERQGLHRNCGSYGDGAGVPPFMVVLVAGRLRRGPGSSCRHHPSPRDGERPRLKRAVQQGQVQESAAPTADPLDLAQEFRNGVNSTWAGAWARALATS